MALEGLCSLEDFSGSPPITLEDWCLCASAAVYIPESLQIICSWKSDKGLGSLTAASERLAINVCESLWPGY